MGASKTWRIPVRGRFTFRPNEPQKLRSGYTPRRVLPHGDPVEQEILEKGSCYWCGRAGRHDRGCPRYF